MIGRHPSSGGRWLQATAISLVLHAGAFALILYPPSFAALPPPMPPGERVIEIEALLPQTPPPEEASIENDPTGPSDPEPAPMPATLSPLETPSEVLQPLDLASAQNPLQTPSIAPVVTLPMESPTAPPAPQAAPSLPEATAPTPMDPELADLVGRLRDQLDIACLLALPKLQGGALALDVLSPSDREITGFVAAISAGSPSEITASRILLDQRQCPGITFLRRSAQYPAYALQLDLQSRDVPSGEAVIGRIGNGAGWYNTLLLIDDNGVVQDLRRFLSAQGGEVTFDIPMTREGAARDTSQILIAIATPGRLQSVTQNAGRLAADFFPALAAELGENARIGVSSLYIR